MFEKRKKFVLLAIVLLAIAGLSACENEVANPFPETIEFATNSGETNFNSPGIIIALVDSESNFSWISGFGYADTVNNVPATEETMFMIGSISKTFTAISIMQLVEAGLIDLDEPIVTYLPEFSILPHPTYGGNYPNITTRMLLNHTAGIPRDYWENGAETADGHYSGFLNNVLTYIPQLTMDFEEGTAVGYSNIGYGILGILVARVSGYEDNFEGFLSYTYENLFEPLGLERSTFAINDELLPNLARSYRNHLLQHEEISFVNILSAGSMTSTVNDMAKLMHKILGDILDGDEHFITQASFEELLEFDFTTADRYGNTFGLGFIHQAHSANLETVGHDGNWVGYHSSMIFDLESGIGVFVAVNSDSARSLPKLLTEQILQRAINEKSGN